MHRGCAVCWAPVRVKATADCGPATMLMDTLVATSPAVDVLDADGKQRSGALASNRRDHSLSRCSLAGWQCCREDSQRPTVLNLRVIHTGLIRRHWRL